MLLGPARGGRRPTAADIRRAALELEKAGVRRLVTPAMNRFEAEAFYQAGFAHLEALHLLLCRLNRVDLSDLSVKADSIGLATGRRWHLDGMLDVDAKAFHGFWRFDHLALKEARTATPSQLTRFAYPVRRGLAQGVARRPVGYAVTGRAGNRGYLQRLAVDPDHQGQGLGTLLVHDAFRWLRRRGADTCLVNTQESNKRALALYEHLGFERQNEGLVVLRWDLAP